MDKQLREQFLNQFSKQHYQNFLEDFHTLTSKHPGFRIAETPVFINKEIKQLMLQTGEEVIDFILSEDFKTLTNKAIPDEFKFDNESEYPQMLVIDFGICKDHKGDIVPKLIELQGFPSLFAFQYYNDQFTREYTNIPNHYDTYLNGYNQESYTQLLEEILIGQQQKESVVLLELFPDQQKTEIDFICTEKLLGIKTVCLTNIIVEGNELYYYHNHKKIKIERIFNRVIFDDIKQHSASINFDFNKKYDVEWIPHPNWYYRISKFTLPFLEGNCIPKSYFLDEIKQPLKLEDFVLKPLFSYAGSGVVINVTPGDIEKITDPQNWILQEKVNYEPVIATLEDLVKTEIRLFYFWKKEWKRPIAVHNLARLSKGDMIGTRHNNNQNWVGGSIAFFEKD